MPSNPDKAVLVTGANGFVGHHLCAHLEGQGHDVRRIQRSGDLGTHSWRVSDLAQEDIPSIAFDGVETLIHLAASMGGEASDPEGAKTALMAARVVRAACAHGVKRVIVLSSVSVRLAQDAPSKARAYALQKKSAEEAALSGLEDGVHCVILRPPVIYGHGARGSFGTLLALVRRAPLLPLKNADAPRSYLSRANLSDLIARLLSASDAQWHAQHGKAFEPHDGADVSTRALVRMIAQQLQRRVILFSVPKPLIRWAGRLTGKRDQADAIFEPLMCEDIEVLDTAFGWHPHEQMPASLKFLKRAADRYDP